MRATIRRILVLALQLKGENAETGKRICEIELCDIGRARTVGDRVIAGERKFERVREPFLIISLSLAIATCCVVFMLLCVAHDRRRGGVCSVAQAHFPRSLVVVEV